MSAPDVGHTPGPWDVEAIFPDSAKGHTFEPHVYIMGPYTGPGRTPGMRVRLADIPDVPSPDSQEMANAHLMAAAPAMATILRNMVTAWDSHSNWDTCEVDVKKARALLARVNGSK